MFPGINKRQMDQMMKKMGVQQVDIDAEQVIIRCADREIIIDNPQVAKVNMMGQQTYQITGEEHQRSIDSTPDINEDDILTVMDQAGVPKEEAIKALEDTGGDLAEAIMNLKE